MANELKDFLATLQPIWENVPEFDWLRLKSIKNTEKTRVNPFELNRFPGLKMALEIKK